MTDFDTLITNGTIVDGSGVPRYRADVGIKDGKIVKIGQLNGLSAGKRLDAHSLIVAPGAIDLHTHFDAQLHWDPYCTIDSWHGVTSLTIGNCGFGFAPVRPEDVERSMLALTRNEAIPLEPMQQTMPFDWETLPQWMDHLERIPLGINIAQHVPVTPVVAYVMGWDESKRRQPNAAEMREIVNLMDEALDAGCIGWSTQRLPPEGLASFQRDYDGTPMVSDILGDEFYLALAEALGRRDRGCMQYTQMTATADDPETGAKRDMAFMERLAEVSGRPLLFNAVAIHDEFPEMFRSQLKWFDECNKKGLRVFGQISSVRASLTCTFEDWNLFDQSDLWLEATLGTFGEKQKKLADPAVRQALREDYDSGEFLKSRPFLPLEIDFQYYVASKIFSTELKEWEGRTVAEIASKQGKHIVDAMLDISIADDLRTEWVTPPINKNPAFARETMTGTYSMAGVSDGGAHMKFLTAGIWPTDLLTWLVRENKILTLEQAHFRLSGMQAWATGITDRGVLREGMAADIMIYDLDKLAIRPTEVVQDLPAGEWRRVQKADGYRWIMVNGEVIFEDGVCTGATPGRLLRHGKAA